MTLIFRKKYVSRYMTYTQQQQQNTDDGCLYDKKYMCSRLHVLM